MRIRHKLVAAAALSLGLGWGSEALAYPMSPSEERQIPALPELAELLDEFTIFVDSDPSVEILYYIPRQGYVAVDGASTSAPVPRFAASRRPSTLQPGAYITFLGGSMSTNGARASLERLTQAASSIGYVVRPAPLERVMTEFMVSARKVTADADGQLRLAIECEDVELTIGGQTTMVQQCDATGGTESDPRLIDAEAMYRFSALSYRGSTVGGRIPFQAILMPGWDEVVQEKLTNGAQWDDILQAKVTWTVKAHRRTHKARLQINWSSVFEQANAFFALHAYSCIDVEVETFFQKIATCEGSAEQCGVSVQWYDAMGRPTDAPSNDAEFVNYVNSLRTNLENELFAEVRPDSSVLGRVRRDTNSFFTLRANYEKRIMNRNEFRDVYWNPGAIEVVAETTLGVGCLVGDVGGRISWDMENEGCRALIQVASSQ